MARKRKASAGGMAAGLEMVGKGVIICRNKETFGDGKRATFLQPNKRPTWWCEIETDWFSRAEAEDAIQWGWDQWGRVCNIVATQASSPDSATFLYVLHSFDGPGKILADMMYPQPNLRQQRCRLDIAEKSLKKYVPLILCHEGGHGISFQHLDGHPGADLMDPTLNVALSGPSAYEAQVASQWYGAPSTTTPPPPPPPPAGGVEVTVKYTATAERFAVEVLAKSPHGEVSLSGFKPWEKPKKSKR